MRKLILLIVVAALGWSGWWFVGSSAVERGARNWFAFQRETGLVAETGEIATRGFPNRFDTTVSDVTLADPVTGYGWRAPFLQVLALSYRPNRLIAVFPDKQTVTYPSGTVDVTSSRMRASLVLDAQTPLGLDRATVVADDVTLSQPGQGPVAIAEARLAMRQTATRGDAYDIAGEGLSIALPEDMLARLGAPDLPLVIERIKVDLVATLTTSAEDGAPRISALDIDDAVVDWDDLGIQGQGRVTVDEAGTPEGQIDLTVENWQGVLDALVAAGIVPGSVAPVLGGMAGLLGGSAGTLDLPIRLSDGQAFLGPVRLGPAPRIALR